MFLVGANIHSTDSRLYTRVKKIVPAGNMSIGAFPLAYLLHLITIFVNKNGAYHVSFF
mgnify:CR=1 FL=1